MASSVDSRWFYSAGHDVFWATTFGHRDRVWHRSKSTNNMMDWIRGRRMEGRGSHVQSHTQTNTHTHTHRHRDTHHPHVSALSSRIRACWGKPQACDCVRGGFWVENSIWTEDPIQRCQYSPHYLCSLLIQGRGEADVEQNVNFENAKQTPIRRWQTVAQQTLWKNMIDNFIIVIWPMFQDF